jgi:hypothetical protein
MHMCAHRCAHIQRMRAHTCSTTHLGRTQMASSSWVSEGSSIQGLYKGVAGMGKSNKE